MPVIKRDNGYEITFDDENDQCIDDDKDEWKCEFLDTLDTLKSKSQKNSISYFDDDEYWETWNMFQRFVEKSDFNIDKYRMCLKYLQLILHHSLPAGFEEKSEKGESVKNLIDDWFADFNLLVKMCDGIIDIVKREQENKQNDGEDEDE